MAKLPNRLVIEIANTDKVDELGCPVVNFESKDYAECVIEELEKIKAEIKDMDWNVVSTIHGRKKEFISKEVIYELLDKYISELKGETEC